MRRSQLTAGTYEIFRRGGTGNFHEPVTVMNSASRADTIAACLAVRQSGMGLRPVLPEDTEQEFRRDPLAEVRVEFQWPDVPGSRPQLVQIDGLTATLRFSDGRGERAIKPTMMLAGHDESDMLVIHTSEPRLKPLVISGALQDAYRAGMDDAAHQDDDPLLKAEMARLRARMQQIAHAISDSREQGIVMAMNHHARTLRLEPMGWPDQELRTTVRHPGGGTLTMIIGPREPEEMEP